MGLGRQHGGAQVFTKRSWLQSTSHYQRVRTVLIASITKRHDAKATP